VHELSGTYIRARTVEIRHAYRILVGKLKARIPTVGPRKTLENIKTCHKAIVQLGDQELATARNA
jgi:hypothetical protein